MKLAAVLLLSLAALASSDSYEGYEDGATARSSFINRPLARRGKSSLAGIVKRLFGIGSTRRQFTGPGTATGTGTGTAVGTAFGTATGPVFAQPAANGAQFVPLPAATNTGFGIAPFLLAGAALLVGLGIIGATLYAATFNNSGRGLDTDEWELDHSVWMDQLQKDFEESWSQN